jgi:ribosomal-protein-alanine N-acetyltransferase
MALPPPRLETERLVIRTARPADVPALLRFSREERGWMRPFVPRRPDSYYTLAHQRRLVRTWEKERRAGRLVIFLLFRPGPRGALLGRVSLTGIVAGALHGCILGYSLTRRAQGRGLMTEALRAVIPYAFGPLRLHRVEAAYMPRNRPSGAVLRRLGFRRVGLARKFLRIDGRWEDHAITARLNPAWTEEGA